LSAAVVWLALGARGQRSEDSFGNASGVVRDVPAALFSAVAGDLRPRTLESETSDGFTADGHGGHLQSTPPWVASRIAAARAFLCRTGPLLRAVSVLSLAPKTSPPAALPMG
jgi:hypothetical protein